MSAEVDWQSLESLFAAAHALAPPAREDLLGRRARRQPSLVAEVRALLDAAEGALGVEHKLASIADLASPTDTEAESAYETPHPTDDNMAAEIAPGDRIGPYRLVRHLGQGGMADVWLADREGAPFKQRVALKLIRGGTDTGRRHADLDQRFACEQQILARLHHPLIVPLLDAGVDPGGGQARPYLAMRYVEGEPIDVYCRRQELEHGDRIRLVVGLCRALQHAHTSLVVHRDIKPSNVLVTDDGQPLLLDFGIAKLIHDPTHTGEGGTTAAETVSRVHWMTPDRAAPEQCDGRPITAATDIYALGLMLHELVSGEVPTGGGVRTTIGGDLDSIVARATAIEPSARYASAGQLGDDLERFLAGHPVDAVGDGLAYRARRFAGRHRLALAGVAIAVLALLGATASAIHHARGLKAAWSLADLEAHQAEDTVDLLIELFELSEPGPHRDGRALSVPTFLDLAARQVDQFRGQPDAQARMHLVLGRIQLGRSQLAEAHARFDRALDTLRPVADDDHPRVLEIELHRAEALILSSRLPEARALLHDLLSRQRRTLGATNPAVTDALIQLARLTPDDAGLALAEEALTIESARAVPEPRALANSLSAVASKRAWQGDRASAATHYRQAVDVLESAFGASHPETQTVLANLARTLDDPHERARRYRRLIVLGERVYGAANHRVANRLSLLGETLAQTGDLVESERLLRDARSRWTRIGGVEHWRTATAALYLAPVVEAQGRAAEALALARHAHDVIAAPGTGEPRMRGAAASQLARLLLRSGESDRALVLAHRGRDDQRVEGHPRLPDGDLVLGLVHLARGEVEDALPMLIDADRARAATLPADHPRRAETACAAASALAAVGRTAEARQLAMGAADRLAAWPLANTGEIASCRRIEGSGTRALIRLDPSNDAIENDV